MELVSSPSSSYLLAGASAGLARNTSLQQPFQGRGSLSATPTSEQRIPLGMMSLGGVGLANPPPSPSPAPGLVPPLARMKVPPHRSPSPHASVMPLSLMPSITGIMPASSTSARSTSPSAPNSVRILPVSSTSRLHRDVAGSLPCLHSPLMSSTDAWQRAVTAVVDQAEKDGIVQQLMSQTVSRLDDADENLRVWATDVITEVVARIRSRRGGQPASAVVPLRIPPSATIGSIEAPVAAQMPVRVQAPPLLASTTVLTPQVLSRQTSVARLVSAPSPAASFSAPSSVAAPAGLASKPQLFSPDSFTRDAWRLPLPTPPVFTAPSPESWRSRSTIGEASCTDVDPSLAIFKRLRNEVTSFSAPLGDLATKLQAFSNDANGAEVIAQNNDIVKEICVQLTIQQEAISAMRSAILAPGRYNNDQMISGKFGQMSTRSGFTESISRGNSTEGRPSAREAEKAGLYAVETLSSDRDEGIIGSSRRVLETSVHCSDPTISPEKDRSFADVLEQVYGEDEVWNPSPISARETSTSELAKAPTSYEVPSSWSQRQSRPQNVNAQGVARSSPRRRATESSPRRRSNEANSSIERRTSSEVDGAGRWKLHGVWIPPGKSVSAKKKPSRMQSSYF